jgi:oxygen-independent coproporphyrinogen-3 oxidase
MSLILDTMPQRLTHLLAKYNVPGPRYTSYPTVPAWTTGVDASRYQKNLVSLQKDETLSLYFHIPFCERLCHFCACMQVITTDHSRSRNYVDTLLQEMNLITASLPSDSRRVSQVHFGGGTPNFLQPEELADIMAAVHRHFRLSPDAELAIEMHPRTSTHEFCDALKALGFNRISLGVQDFDPEVQALINRHQSYEMTEAMLSYLRKLGFDSFNFDLIYGLPGQNKTGWQKTLEQVLELRPNRLAVYSYAHVPWVRPVQRSFKDSDLPAPEDKLRYFEMAYEAFVRNGYRSIGMDHFALKEDDLCRALNDGTLHRNFMGYSTKADAHQIGFGVSAISYVAGGYFQNLKELRNYEAAIQEGHPATFRGFTLSHDDALRRELITRIMCRGKVNLKEFEEQWDIRFNRYFSDELHQLSALREDGLLDLDGGLLQATETGQLFLRNIAMIFDRYLADIQSKAENPTFSKTV